MSAQVQEYDEGPGAEPLGLAPDPVEIRRNGGLAALIGALASIVAIGYLARAAVGGSALDWVLAVALGLLGLGHLASFVDARVPLLVADSQGIRLRLGRTWQGLPWGAIAEVVHRPRRGLLRDGRLAVVVRNPARVTEELDRRGRWHAVVATRLYGSPFALPLALTTRVTGGDDSLTEMLERLSGGSTRIVETGPVQEVEDLDDRDVVEPAAEPEVEDQEGQDDQAVEAGERRWRLRDPRPWLARQMSELTASRTPSPVREPAPAARAEITRQVDPERAPAEMEETAAHDAVDANLLEDTVTWGERLQQSLGQSLGHSLGKVRPISRGGRTVDPLVFDDFEAEPADDPVIGPEFAAARTRLGLSIDQLADRTRIRPHVLESIEVDDFVPCGGDFYARGHIRTLSRVLGVDVVPLLTHYDERYADAPVSPRRVFEAELASGSIRGTRGGPDWSIFVAAVMALVLAWSVARLVMDNGAEAPKQPALNGSAGVALTHGKAAPAVPVVLTAAGGGARVIVRDGTGAVVYNGPMSFGETRTFKASPPVRIQTSDGSVTATVDGRDRGALGKTGRPAQNTFVVD